MNLDGDGLDAPLLERSDTKKLSYFQFVWTTFLLTSAGPFGFEYTVSGVGVGNSLWLIALFALLYALPIALISSELSGLMPSRHGQIAWGYRAFSKLNPEMGDYIGFLNASNIVIFWILNTAVLPIVLVQYLTTLTGALSSGATYCIRLGVILSGLVLNCFNFSIIASITSVLCIAIVVPFFVAFFWRIPNIDPATQWTECSVGWALAVTTCLWEFSGFESLANIMNEANFKPRRLISAYSIAIILDAMLLAIPIITSATLEADACGSGAWYDGYFAASFEHLAVGMKYAVAIGSVLMNWCMYLAAIGVISRMIWAMAQPYFEITRDGQMISPRRRGNSDGNNTQIAVNILPHRFFGEIWDKTGSAVYSVVVVTIIVALTNIYLNFDDLVEFNIFIYFVPFTIELFAYLALKHVEPNAPRPFEIPFGRIGAWVTVSVVFIALSICFCIMVVVNPLLFGIAVALNLGLTAYYFITKRFCHRMYQRDVLLNRINRDKFETISDDGDTTFTTETSVDDEYEELQPLIL